VLVNNAAGVFLRRQETVDGFEKTFALNHLNYFMLTNLLLDVLQASAPARIVNVASDSHRDAELDLDDLQLAEGYNPMRAYGRSKLANVLFTYELARRLEGSGVTANALHPGFVNTHLGKSNWLVRIALTPIHWLFAKSPREGAQTSIYLASSPEVAGVSGKYFVDCEPTRSAPASYDEAAAQRLWEVSATLTEVSKV
jgi:NAD(P)-dependent dehydrogenase (short-subunit alcohol dehydrogenase family)